MKVLVVSHNVFSYTSSMGKTLISYFSNFDSNNLAQFFIHSEHIHMMTSIQSVIHLAERVQGSQKRALVKQVVWTRIK